MYWTLTCDFGVGIREYDTEDPEEALEKAIREVGTRQNPHVEPTTDEHIDWVSGMGGNLPDSLKKKIHTR